MKALLFICVLFVHAAIFGQNIPSFQITPNPANQKANLILQNIDLQHIEVAVFTIFGTPVPGIYQQVQIREGKIQLYFPNLNEGIYLVRLRSTDFDQTQRLKIQRN